MLNKNVVSTLISTALMGLMLPAAANAASATFASLASSDDDAVFSTVGFKANSLFNDFFTLSTPTGDASAATAALGEGMPPTVPASTLSFRDDPDFPATVTRNGDTSPASWTTATTDSYTAPLNGPEGWSMIVIGAGLVAFRLRRRPDMNTFSYS